MSSDDHDSHRQVPVKVCIKVEANRILNRFSSLSPKAEKGQFINNKIFYW